VKKLEDAGQLDNTYIFYTGEPEPAEPSRLLLYDMVCRGGIADTRRSGQRIRPRDAPPSTRQDVGLRRGHPRPAHRPRPRGQEGRGRLPVVIRHG
jgi:hypothetical protein